MIYKNQLQPWCIIRPLPNLQRVVVARFRRCNDAEAYLQVLRRLVSGVAYQIVFDVESDDTEENA